MIFLHNCQSLDSHEHDSPKVLVENLKPVLSSYTKVGFQTDARKMSPSVNKIAPLRVQANKRATSKYQFETPS